jgi:hypothetical protein
LLLLPLIVTGLLVFTEPSGVISLLFGSAYAWALLVWVLMERP